MKKRKEKEAAKRPYTTDYGTSKGHCETPQGAVLAAMRYMRLNGRKHTVIEPPHGPPVDIWWSGFWGISVQVRSSKAETVASPLRRVK